MFAKPALFPVFGAILSAALLTGCEGVPEKAHPLVGTPKRIEVQSDDRFLTLEASLSGGPATAALAGFLDRQQAGPGMDILLSWNKNDAAADQQIAILNAYLQSLGFRDIYRDPALPTPAMGQTQIILRRYQATVPGCDRPENINGYANGPMGGFGCANLQNLAAMVADPRDLIRGRPMDRRYAASLTVGYQRILIDNPKELPGGISEIGGGSEE